MSFVLIGIICNIPYRSLTSKYHHFKIHYSPSRSAFLRFIQTHAKIVASSNNEPPPVPPAINGKYDFGVFTVVSFSVLSDIGGGVDGSEKQK